MSGTTGGEAELLSFSFDTLINGKPVGRDGDLMFHNQKNAISPSLNIQGKPPKPPGRTVDVVLTDSAGDPVPDELFELKADGKKIATGKLDKNGKAKVHNVKEHDYTVEFPNLIRKGKSHDQQG